MKKNALHALLGSQLLLVLAFHPAWAQWAPVATYSAGAGSGPAAVAVGDVNGDGRPDAVTANFSTNTVGVLLGQAGGGLAPAVTYASSGTPYGSPNSVALGDVTGDGRLDIVVTNSSSGTVGVLAGQVAGGFAPAAEYSIGAGSNPNDVVLRDLNGDGQLDMLVSLAATNSVGILLGQAGGGFAAVSSFLAGVGSGPAAVAVADVNGDGRPDAVTANRGSNTLGVLPGLASGGFGPASTYSTGAGSEPGQVVLADVNGDGRLDAVTAHVGTSAVGVLLGQASGSFAPVTTYSTGRNSIPTGVAVADVNGDGRPDLLAALFGGDGVGVLLGQVGGGFASVTTYSTGTSSMPREVTVADVNADGRPDLVTANFSTNAVGVLRNTMPLAAQPVGALARVQATVFPNPAQGAASVTLEVAELPAAVRHLDVALLNALGQVVARTTVAASQGQARLSLPTAGLVGGLYQLRLQALDAQRQGLGAVPTQRLVL